MAIRVLSWVLALIFIAAGVPKILDVAQFAAQFEHFGYSPTFRHMIGVLEVAGAVALLVPGAALYGALLLLAIMVGATWTVLRAGEALAPPIIVGALLAVLAILRTLKPQAD
jgi:putative oxidoreductase